MASPTLSLLVRSSAPRRSLAYTLSAVSRSSTGISSFPAHLLLRPSQRYASAVPPSPPLSNASSIPTPPSSVRAAGSAEPVQVGGEDQVLPGGENDNAKLYSNPDTLSYRELLRIFSKTLTDAFATPPPRASSGDRSAMLASHEEYDKKKKRPGMAVMEDPGTYHMVERIREAGLAEGLELEAVNQHILEVLDSIAPPPTEISSSPEEVIAEAEEELKVALQMFAEVKQENLERYQQTTSHKIYSFLPSAIGSRLDARKLRERNTYDARLTRLMARIMDCGFEAKRAPQEMSLLIKRGYFPPGDPDAIPAETEEEKREADQGEIVREYKQVVGHPGSNQMGKPHGLKF